MEAATLEALAPVHTEVPAPVPEPTIAEILDQHLSHAQQKKIAVENLSSIKFLIAPDGKSAVSTKELPSDTHKQIVEESLQRILGHRAEDAPYLPEAGGLADKLGLSLSSKFVEIRGAETIKTLAEAGVKDFAGVLEHQHERGAEQQPMSHAGRVRASTAPAAEPVPAL